MKEGIHPDYVECTVHCSCGNTFQTRATAPELHIELCSECHPFYTGKQKFVDAGGRVQRFANKFGSAADDRAAKAAADREARQKAHEEAVQAAREARAEKEAARAARAAKYETAKANEAGAAAADGDKGETPAEESAE